MAYDDTFSNIIQGLGNFSQGYMQGKRMREEDAMRRAQFEQQQRMAGLQYRQAEQRMAQDQQDREIAKRSADLARATMAGDWPTASRMHAELTDGSIIGVDAYDDDNVKITRADNQFSVIPKREYAEIMAAGDDHRMMTGAISRIMTAEARADLAAKKAENQRLLQEQKDKARGEEGQKKRDAIAEQKELDRKHAERLLRIRQTMKAAGGSGGAPKGYSGKVKFEIDELTELNIRDGMSPEDARSEARRFILTKAPSMKDDISTTLSGSKALMEVGGKHEKEAVQRVADIVGQAEERMRKRKGSGTGATVPKPAAAVKSNPVDFSRMGFQRDAASGNYKNSKGIWFKNTDNGPVYWDKSTDTWKPVPKKSK